jgi:hypothetical protein
MGLRKSFGLRRLRMGVVRKIFALRGYSVTGLLNGFGRDLFADSVGGNTLEWFARLINFPE